MRLEGIHHISAITGDARRNLDFYVRVMGLRLVKKTVNQDAPTVYHLFYADDAGSPGTDLTFFEYPGARPGRAGAGMVHRIVWRVGAPAALDFWEQRLAAEGVATTREQDGERLRFADPEGLEHELGVFDVPDAPLSASAPDIPAAHALQGFAGAHAYSAAPERSQRLLDATLGFVPADGADRADADATDTADAADGARWEARGEERGGFYVYDPAPAEPGIGGAGTVHHIAWAAHDDDYDAWYERIVDAGEHPSPKIDRFYFRSIYFREPSGVLFEIATLGPGFTADEPLEELGEHLALPPKLEPMRASIERAVTPLPSPRAPDPRT